MARDQLGHGLVRRQQLPLSRGEARDQAVARSRDARLLDVDFGQGDARLGGLHVGARELRGRMGHLDLRVDGRALRQAALRLGHADSARPASGLRRR